MKVIRPTFVTDANLTSSSLTENDYPAWSASTGYTTGQRVIQGHHRWESVFVGTNTGNDPLLETDASRWLDLGATNRWAMFDQAKGSLSSGTSTIQVVLTPGRIDSLALLDLNAKSVRVTVTIAGVSTPVYDKTQSTNIGGRGIDNWYDWFFAPIGQRTTLLFDDLPSYKNGIVTVLIDGGGTSAPVACGTLLIGRMFQIGTTLSGADLGINDYSKKDRDQFGVVTLVARPFSDSNKYSILMDSAQVDAVRNALSNLRATPTVWIGDDGLDALQTYGFYSSFRINVALLNGTSTVSLEVEGLV